MKVSEIREMTPEELQAKMKSLYQEGFNLRFRHATSQLENTARIREVRRDIARIKTVVGESALLQAKES